MEEQIALAVAEAAAYARMGGLDDAMIADIAIDHGVSVGDILTGIGWA